MASKGYLPLSLGYTRPLSRLEMARAISVLLSDAALREKLTDAEEGELERFAHEFKGELRVIGAAVPDEGTRHGLLERLKDGDPLLSFREGESEINFRPVVRLRFVGEEENWTYQRTAGGVLSGNLRGSLHFYINPEDTREGGSKSYDPWRNPKGLILDRGAEYVKLLGSSANYERTIAYLVFELPWFEVEFGKDRLRWGPGYFGNLALSLNAPSLTMVKLSARYGRFKFTWLSGALRDAPASVDTLRSYESRGGFRRLERRRYIAAHRLEIAPRPWIELGFHEVVIYGDRGPEPSYLNPIMFYWSAEHYLGDRDNATMGADFVLRPVNGLTIYGSVFLDDFDLLDPDLGRAVNKIGLTGGFFWAGPFGIADADLRTEYTRIEPWVYTHRYPVNVYQHYGWCLGHWLGPNADGIFVQARYRFSHRLEASLTFRRLRKGRNKPGEDVGGDIFQWTNVERKRFLAGALERNTSVGIGVSYEMESGLSLRAAFRRSWLKSELASGEDSHYDVPYRGEISLEYNFF